MRLSPDAWSRTLIRSRGLVGRGYGMVRGWTNRE